MRDALSDEQLAEIAASPPDGHGPWSQLAFRVASLEDAVNWQTNILIWAAGDRKKPPEKPELVRRPGIGGPARKRRILSAEGRAYLDHLRNNQGALPPGYRAVAVGR